MQKILNLVRPLTGVLVRLLALLTVALLAILGALLAWAARLEAVQGREYAQWYVYDAPWFLVLLGALAVLVVASLVCFLWRWSRAGVLIASLGILVLLAGFIQTWWQGIEGQVILRPGDRAANSVWLTRRSQLTLLSPHGKGVRTAELGFSPGPADWQSGQPLDFGEVDGVDVKVLELYRYARYEVDWVADPAALAKPAIEVAVPDAPGGGSAGRWFVPMLFGTPIVPGKTNVSIEQAVVPSLRDDFLQPPPVKPGSLGILSMHYKDHIYRVPVDGNLGLGKKLPVGDSGLSVQIVAYYANAKSSQGKFNSEGTEPKNPMLQLQVYTPGRKKPVSEIAYANQPFVTMEAIKRQPCPVRFWYHHPATPALARAEFLQTPDGKLYCRVGDGRVYHSRGEVHEGDRIAMGPDRQITLLRYIPHARQQAAFTPIERAAGEKAQAEAAALVELTSAGKSQQVWLGRNDARLGMRELQTPGGPLAVMFGYERSPLGFSVKLAGFEWDKTADSPGDASCVSRVRFSDDTQDPGDASAGDPQEISTDRPLRHGAFTFYQSGFRQLPNKVELSVLRVTSDPGRLLKHSGMAILGVAVVLMLLVGVFGRGRLVHRSVG